MSKRRTLSVKNLDRYQHYGERRSPPWVKLYREVMTDYELCRMSVESRLFFHYCLIIASEVSNCIPYDTEYLSQRCSFKVTDDIITPLIHSGQLIASGASKSLASAGTRSSLLLSSSESSLNPKKEESEKETKNGKGKRPFPEEFKIEEKHKELAAGWKLDVGYEFGKFKNYCLANGKQYSDYVAAFRNWLANAYERKQGGHA